MVGIIPRFLLGPGLFSGAFAVSFREGNISILSTLSPSTCSNSSPWTKLKTLSVSEVPTMRFRDLCKLYRSRKMYQYLEWSRTSTCCWGCLACCFLFFYHWFSMCRDCSLTWLDLSKSKLFVFILFVALSTCFFLWNSRIVKPDVILPTACLHLSNIWLPQVALFLVEGKTLVVKMADMAKSSLRNPGTIPTNPIRFTPAPSPETWMHLSNPFFVEIGWKNASISYVYLTYLDLFRPFGIFFTRSHTSKRSRFSHQLGFAPHDEGSI